MRDRIGVPVWVVLTVATFTAYGQTLADRAAGILGTRCYGCHGEAMAMSGLRLVERGQALRGGTRGAAIEPGNATGSLLYQAVAHTGKVAMPPGNKLPDEEIETLRAWIDAGAEWPKQASLPRAAWWAFSKLQRPAVPKVEGASAEIDAFLLERLRAVRIEPAAQADRLTLLRRACFDLLGLPPTPEQIRTFLDDHSTEAWPHLIDSLLASPHYGEKWGRFWLDLVRYGDTSGFEQDPYILEAWRYRDWVIKSFNDDKPYDRFAKEQIAGDELWPDEPEARMGTGYYRVGTNRDMLFKVEDLNRVEKLTDYVDTTSSVFLGLTVGCARCHDHKFDPIPQRDFYRTQAIFAPAVNDRVFVEYNAARFYDLQANSREFKLWQIGDQIDRLFKPYRERLRKNKTETLPADQRSALSLAAASRTQAQQDLAGKAELAVKVSDDEIRASLSAADTERLHAIETRLVSMFAGYGPAPTGPGIVDMGREAPRTYIAQRGNPNSPGEEVRPGFLSALGGGDIPDPPLHANSTGRRKTLAEWMASAENPLFARVMVNRIWQGHFGRGLLKTPSDFGTRAGKPSHPELLDWLATEFAARGWSIKKMHKLMMMTDAYRRSAVAPAAAGERDPENALLSHMNRRRLDAEEIRDAVLQVTGGLNLKMGGPPVVPPLESEELYGIIGRPENVWVVTPDPREHTRRSVYLLHRRTFQQPMLESFDAPDGVLSCPRRNESTTAPQSLALLNGRFMVERARLLAAQAQSIGAAWERVLGRKPTSAEETLAAEFLERQAARLGSMESARAELVRSLLNLNEFLYVD